MDTNAIISIRNLLIPAIGEAYRKIEAHFELCRAYQMFRGEVTYLDGSNKYLIDFDLDVTAILEFASEFLGAYFEETGKHTNKLHLTFHEGGSFDYKTEHDPKLDQIDADKFGRQMANRFWFGYPHTPEDIYDELYEGLEAAIPGEFESASLLANFRDPQQPDLDAWWEGKDREKVQIPREALSGDIQKWLGSLFESSGDFGLPEWNRFQFTILPEGTYDLEFGVG